jgi:hypothetical protein
MCLYEIPISLFPRAIIAFNILFMPAKALGVMQLYAFPAKHASQ